MMNNNTIVSEILALTYLILAPNVFSIILSLCGTVYFLAMLKMNVIDVNYDRSWKKFLRSWFINPFKK